MILFIRSGSNGLPILTQLIYKDDKLIIPSYQRLMYEQEQENNYDRIKNALIVRLFDP
jgi:hypothetical protein